MSDALKTVAETLVRYCREGKEQQGLDELYAADAVSMEAQPGPDGGDQEFTGIDAIRGKHAWWSETMDEHAFTVDGPYPHGEERFAVIYEADVTNRQNGERHRMREIAVYHVADGKIVREEFFYPY